MVVKAYLITFFSYKFTFNLHYIRTNIGDTEFSRAVEQSQKKGHVVPNMLVLGAELNRGNL